VVALVSFDGDEQPSWLQARRRYVYVVPALSRVSVKNTAFSGAIATTLNARPPLERSISKRVSLGLASVHERSMRDRIAPVAVRFLGGIGTLASVRALATFENGPKPPELKARTRKKYVVLASRPKSIALVAVVVRMEVHPTPSSDRWIS
jgi:hypothetical protein